MVSLTLSLPGPLETNCGLTIIPIREGSRSIYATLCDTDSGSQYFTDKLPLLAPFSLSSFLPGTLQSLSPGIKQMAKINSSELKEKMRNFLYRYRGISRGDI